MCNLKTALMFLATLFSISCSNKGASMSVFDIGKACVFSQVKGQVTFEGKPVSGAKIVRIAKWQKEETDETMTDSEGNFELPPMYHRSVVKLLPAEFVTSQRLMVIHDNKEYGIWFTTKRAPEENSELNGKPLAFKCELTDEPRFDHSYRASIKTICTWE